MVELLSLEAVALRLKYPIGTLRRLMSQRRFPFSKIGGRICVDEAELETFLKKAQRVTAEEAAQPRPRTQHQVVA